MSRHYEPAEYQTLWNIFKKIIFIWSIIGFLLAIMAIIIASAHHSIDNL